MGETPERYLQTSTLLTEEAIQPEHQPQAPCDTETQTMHQNDDLHHSHLPELLITAHRHLQESLNTTLQDSLLSVDQWRILRTLGDKQGRTVSELAKDTGLKISGLSKNLDKLCERALLFRRQDDTDHRKINIFISDFGIEQLDNCEQQMEMLHRQLASKLGKRDCKTLDRLLRKLATATSKGA